MKKFLAIFTIVAMLSGMCTIGASAATDALDATIELVEATAEVTNVDLGAALGAQLSYDPRATNFAGLANEFSGFHAITGVGSASTQWWASSSNGPSDFRATAVRIPEFFKDKPAGEYKINFRVRARGAYSSPEELGGYILDVAETVNTGVPTYAESFQVLPGDYGSWASKNVEFTFNYDGSAEITNPNVDANDYDPYALCLYLVSQKSGGKQYCIDHPSDAEDHFYVTAPVTAGKNVKATNTITGDFADSVLINAVYDGEGNLVTVGTKELESESSVELKLPYEGEVAYDWTFKGFIWKDLDNTIEPLAETEEIGFGALLPYVFTEDFSTFNAFDGTSGATAAISIEPTNAGFIGLKDNAFTGVFKASSADTGTSTDEEKALPYYQLSIWRQTNGWAQGPDSSVALNSRGLSIAIPEFFKDKPAGEYTIEFDWYDTYTGTSRTWAPMKAAIIDIGASVNNGKITYLESPFSATDDSIWGSWQHSSYTFTYDGNVTTIDGANADNYDPYMFLFVMGRGRDTYYIIDNIKITAPFTAQ